MKEKIYIVAYIFGIPFRFELARKYDISNEFIGFRNINVQSHIDFVSEYGITISNDSNSDSSIDNILIYARKGKLQNKLISSTSEKSKLHRYDFHSVFSSGASLPYSNNTYNAL